MITLMEAAKLDAGAVFRNTIISHFAMSSDLLNALTFENVQGGAYVYNMEGQLPGVAFRGIGEGYSASAGILNPQTERLRVAGGDLDVDLATLKISGADVRSKHELLKVKALSLTLGAKIINGNSLTDPREFDGLRVRIQGDQLLDAGATDGGDALKITKLRDLVDAVDNPTHLIMSKRMRNLLTAAASDPTVGGYITQEVGNFGKRITLFDGLPIIVMDKDSADGSDVIAFNEVGAGGATATATSIYAVNLGEEGVVGLQNGVMEVRDLGELQTHPVVRTRVEWMMGLAVMQGRAAARLRGVANVAVTK